MASKQVPKWLTEVLNEYSTDKFNIESKGSSYNHLDQGAIALWRLGASEEQVKRFAELYSKDLEPAVEDQQDKGPGASNNLLTETELKDLIGRRKKFPLLVAHYQQRLADLGGDLKKLINAEFPSLIEFIASDNFHGVIEVGYGLSIGDGRIVCQGLAYMYYSGMPFRLGTLSSQMRMGPPLGLSKYCILDIFPMAEEYGRLATYMEDKIQFRDERDANLHLVKMYTLLTHRWNDLLKLVMCLWIPLFDLDSLRKEKDTFQRNLLGTWMMGQAFDLYSLSASRNNSYFLHGVTGAWGLRQIVLLLEDRDKVFETAMYFMCSLLAMYIAEGCPELKKENAVLPKDGLEDFKKMALEKDYNVHFYKLIDVCCHLYQEDETVFDRTLRITMNVALTYPTTKATQ